GSDPDGDLHRGRVHVIGALPTVDVFERMYDVVVTSLMAEDLQSPVGDDLVGVHIRRCAGAALDLVDDELVVQGAAADLDARRDDGCGDRGVELSELLIGLCRRLLYRGKRHHEVAAARDGYAADREVLECTRGMHSVVDIGGNVPVAEQVV